MKQQIFTAFLPLVLFWAVEEFLGLKAALIVGCIAAVGELAWERIKRGRVSFVTWASNLLVLGLGAISYFMDSGVFFKLQPAVMEIAMAVMMVATRLRGGEPFLLRMFREGPVIDPGRRDAALANEAFVARLRVMDLRMTIFLIIHGLAVAWAAIWASSRVWILLKGVLFYVLMMMVMLPETIAGVIAQRRLRRRSIDPKA
jgi:intracellular septation protein